MHVFGDSNRGIGGNLGEMFLQILNVLGLLVGGSFEEGELLLKVLDCEFPNFHFIYLLLDFFLCL